MRTKDRYAMLGGRFWRHPKAMAASADALALWVRALSYVVDQMTDGHVARAVAESLCRKHLDRIAAELVSLGLWQVHAVDGWVFHDYEDHNITRAEWEKEAERNRNKTNRSRGKPPAVTEAVTGNTPGTVTGNSQTQDARRKTQDIGGEADASRTPPPSDDPIPFRDEIKIRWRRSYEQARDQVPATPDDTATRELATAIEANVAKRGGDRIALLEAILAAYWRDEWPRVHANRASVRNLLGQFDRLLALVADPPKPAEPPKPLTPEEAVAAARARAEAHNRKLRGVA